MGFNSGFKGLTQRDGKEYLYTLRNILEKLSSQK